ncbi:MAG: hypothetical protein K0S91_740 [Nitrososphaeraceae archaeon]|nr:hypothetical protein [Nitrososphaeraceae archaeon]
MDIAADPLNQQIHILFISVLALCIKGAHFSTLRSVPIKKKVDGNEKRSFFKYRLSILLEIYLQISEDRKKRVIDLYFDQHKTYAEIAQIENYHNKCISYKLLSVNDYEQMALTKEIGLRIG